MAAAVPVVVVLAELAELYVAGSMTSLAMDGEGKHSSASRGTVAYL